MRKQTIVFIACLFALFVCVPVYGQKGVSGRWEWTGPLGKDKMKDYLSIDLKPRAGKVAGTFFYNQLDANGDTESDGGVTAFAGTVNGDTVRIEFDPNAEEPGYTENLRYKKPKGKLPSLATLTFKNGKLVWTQTRGSLGKGIPKQFTMRRSK